MAAKQEDVPDLLVGFVDHGPEDLIDFNNMVLPQKVTQIAWKRESITEVSVV